MYGLSYCRLPYDTLMEMDLDTLGILFGAEIAKEERVMDNQMQMLAWQTAQLMNATGNYKSPVKPEKLYTSPFKDKSVNNGKSSVTDIEKKREELKKTFGITE